MTCNCNLDFKNGTLKAYLMSLRPNQWTKNLLVFAAPLLAFQINLSSFSSTLIAFCLFCLISSSFYLLNDVKDLESDRQHPVKCNRPIAAGYVSVPIAVAMASFFILVSLGFSWFYNSSLGAVLTCYSLIQVAYNLKLKQVPLLDIACIANGFVLRACAGFVVTHTYPSPWFLIFIAMLALFLAIEKRKAELQMLQIQGKIGTREVLKLYSLPLLNRMESIVATGAVMSYAIWCSGWNSSSDSCGVQTPWTILTLPFVLYGIFRYQLLGDSPAEVDQVQKHPEHLKVDNQKTEVPDRILLSDNHIKYTIIAWLITYTLILWLNSLGLI
ncbi:MAG: decaprenyl-phosphate phosphoribosyltransferase [Okeania sp. SIO3I5]|uniref:decaprenyl-phosphate phosphoribosyltransferase n=1 Tax=Okeania sp. SIO3I5 TaxID=2607805 RepID=UPI0013BA527C|nr:decaprenyl-phosphate phosphoribosyltransferase [Okeania sp. SIO3I5]NEQ37997.1 decaprenyl-phosphate phosphoribosyltransferase [Okeania sp. SIO3I5]